MPENLLQDHRISRAGIERPVPLRVLQVVRPASGGIRQHVLELIRGLAAEGVECGVAAPVDFLGNLPVGLPVAVCSALGISASMGPADLMVAGRLSKLVAGYDLVHAHGLRAAWVAGIASGMRPFTFLFTAHNLVPEGPAARVAMAMTGRSAAAVLAVSTAVREGLAAAGVPGDRLRLIPNGVDIERFSTLPSNARNEFGLAPGAAVVGCVARLSPEKGVDILVAAARLLPEATFLVAGDGPERSALAAAAPANVRFLGRLDDVRSVLAAADVLAIPSRKEGQGIVALEAMAAHVPLVVASVGGLAGMFVGSGAALLTPPGDPTALAGALHAVLNDSGLRADLARRAWELVNARYGAGRATRDVASVYRRVHAAEHPGGGKMK
ncbi:MAG: glycosyltransferase family 4 protein [Capsulimonadaceae bacterium]